MPRISRQQKYTVSVKESIVLNTKILFELF